LLTKNVQFFYYSLILKESLFLRHLCGNFELKNAYRKPPGALETLSRSLCRHVQYILAAFYALSGSKKEVDTEENLPIF
jgi:hypothetical protein